MLRQLLVLLRPEVMDIRVLRQRRSIDLRDRPDEDEAPVASRTCDRVYELEIEPLVDDTGVPDSRVWDCRLVLRIAGGLACACEVVGLDAGREAMHVAARRPLRLEQARATGENE